MATTDDAQTARRHAYGAAAAVWSEVGRPGAQVGQADYIWLHDTFCAHLRVRFGPALGKEEVAEIVDVCLRSFLAPLYIRHQTEGGGPSPEDLFRHLDDVALERLAPSNTPPDAPDTGCDEDEDVVSAIFGEDVDVAGYHDALQQLIARGGKAEYLVVTQYVDQQVTTGKAPSFKEVAERLGRPEISEAKARQLIFRFAGRLPRRAEP